ncbi:amino-acid N-acetyltransferase [Gammaproteobacteria bacterium AH-315-C21]|nr:amino-acid N-acetyltransferase [Gammaproteobacteria bacterium AH-315-C21]
MSIEQPKQFVRWLRHASPYIHAFSGKTFVIAISGEAIKAKNISHLIHDIALLQGLGVKLVLVPGSRPQIEQRLAEQGTAIRYIGDKRITDAAAMQCVKEAASSVRINIEAQLSMGLAESPMAGVAIRVISGNFITAKPIGVRDGVDHLFTGEVRRVDDQAIKAQLDNNAIVLVPALGYSPSGEVFNLTAYEIAAACAGALGADKLILLNEERGILDSRRRPIPQLNLAEAENLLASQRRLSDESKHTLEVSISACKRGVQRCHIVSHEIDGGLLLELFTRDGIGSLISADVYEGLRPAVDNDISGIVTLIEPLETEGVLVRRSRDQLESEIARFHVVERDGAIIGCAALYPSADKTMAELACVAVHPEYRDMGYGAQLLKTMEKKAREHGIKKLFLLTTRTSHWFREHGFRGINMEKLPKKRRELYNYQRNAKVLIKTL